MKRYYACLLIIIVTFFTIMNARSNYTFKIYGSAKCPHCMHEKELLSVIFPDAKVEFHDVSEDKKSSEVFEKIYERVFPGEKVRYIPLVVGLRNGKLFAICVGALGKNFWKAAVESRKGVYIRFPGEKLRIENIDLSDIKELEIKKSLGEILSICIASAFLDAVNPCAFNVLLVFLTLMVLNVEVKRKVLQSGMAFTVATFVIYYLMGLGLLKVIEGLQWIKYILYAFALWIGFMELINGIRGKEWSPIPAKWKEGVSKGLGMILSPLGALLIGGFVGVVLLPCTSGPYVVALSALCGIKGMMRYIILLLYNLIFVFPFIALTLFVSFGLRTSSLKKFKKKTGRIVEITTGGALISLVVLSAISRF